MFMYYFRIEGGAEIGGRGEEVSTGTSIVKGIQDVYVVTKKDVYVYKSKGGKKCVFIVR